MRRLPDGTMKAEADMTAEDYQVIMNKILDDYKDVIDDKPSKADEEVKRIANKNSRKKTKGPD